ncbi:MAG: metal ABC transporter ATP-binding protein [Treponema sp.]
MQVETALDELFTLHSNTPVHGPRIRFEKVSLTLNGTALLKDISFTVRPGEIHCIIGTNGSGKTSLLKCLLGQMPHTGEIALYNTKKTQTGYMPQVLDFDRTLPISVGNFMSMLLQKKPAFLGPAAGKKRTVQLCLKIAGMDTKEQRLLGQLSGGEMQRVLLAQALFPMPDLLVLDEPLAGVDSSFTGIFERILRYAANRGITIVWINHDLQQAKKMADTITCINKTLVFSGKAETYLPDTVFRQDARKI